MSGTTIEQQLNTAVHLVEKHKLINPHVYVHCDDPTDCTKKPLTVNDTTGLHSLRVWLHDHSGHITGVVGDHEDGRKNVIFAVP